MHIRTEEAADIPRVHAVNLAAFESATEATLVDALRVQAVEAIPLVVEDDDDIVGHIMFSPVRLTGADEIHTMALAPMAVTPARQRAGIGSALVRGGLAMPTTRYRSRVRGWDPSFYLRFGFSLASNFGIACEFEVPDEAFMALELVAGALRGKAGTVFFHPAFHAP